MKFIDRWKSEWWIKESANLANQYESKKKDLVIKFESELLATELEWTQNKKLLENKICLEQQEINFRLDSIESRKQELLRVDNDLKTQIKIIEAKAHPSEIWAQAFTAGVTKSWDLIQPFMTENIEKIKKQLYDDAYTKAIGSLNGNHKKNY